MFQKILVANRGEIARRIMRSAHGLGVATVAVYSTPDADQPHVTEATEAVEIGEGPAAESYLNGERIIAAAVASGAEAIHPGYGFLSENADFARAVVAAGLVWIGPSPETMEKVADKGSAQVLLHDVGMPTNEGASVADSDAAGKLAADIGYPVIVKARGGGGGIGMQVVAREADLAQAVEKCQKLGQRFFGQPDVLVERYLPDARHVEVQVFGLADGRVLALGERECSVQRRYQKVMEEAPSPVVGSGLRERMFEAARRGAQHIGYRNAGTFEFLVAGDDFMFLEVNARLQVEHTITELTTGLDLVTAQLKLAAGEEPDIAETPPTGHALEMRIYAEDPITFFPSPGKITRWSFPDGEGIRLDSGYEVGGVVSQFYDPLLAKLCVHAPTRAQALSLGREAIANVHVEGVKTNVAFLARVLDDEGFSAGSYDVRIADRLMREAQDAGGTA